MRDLKEEIDRKIKKTSNKDAINQILDEQNSENVVLFDADNRPIEFEQIALIPLKNASGADDLYAILIPITKMQGVNEGEGVVLKILEQAHDVEVVNDSSIIDKVLEVYEKLISEGEEGE